MYICLRNIIRAVDYATNEPTTWQDHWLRDHCVRVRWQLDFDNPLPQILHSNLDTCLLFSRRVHVVGGAADHVSTQ